MGIQYSFEPHLKLVAEDEGSPSLRRYCRCRSWIEMYPSDRILASFEMFVRSSGTAYDALVESSTIIRNQLTEGAIEAATKVTKPL